MGDILWLLIVFAILGVFIAVLSVLVKKLERQKRLAGDADALDAPGAGQRDAVPYRAVESVLSQGEQAFLPALREAVQLLATARKLPSPMVLACVRLAEVLEVDTKRSNNPSRHQSALNRITRKQVDFVLCHPETTRPVLVVELDDITHARSDRKGRDQFVDRACDSAGLPILHVRAAPSYNPQGLAQDIGRLLLGKAT